MSKFVYLLDAGHGKETSGKRSPVWPDGSQYFEWEGTRAIRRQLAAMLAGSDIDFHFVNTGSKDTNLDDRVDVVNAHCRQYGTKNCILISIHSNGFKKQSANGWEVFTTRGTTESDKIATILFEEHEKMFSDRRFRSDKKDGDVDKEANFYIIANSKCRAVLTENFFHTNKSECQQILMKPEGRRKIALAHFKAICRMEEEL